MNEQPRVFLGVVQGRDGVRLSTTASSRGELVKQLASYVRRHADGQLWPKVATHVSTLLDRGELEAAIEVYFGLVGSRWDEEWLFTARIDVPGSRHAVAAIDRVVPARGDDQQGEDGSAIAAVA